MYLSRTSIILKQNMNVHYWRLFKVSAFSFNRKIVIIIIYFKINNNYKQNGGQIMSMLISIGSLIVVIALAITIFRNPDLKDKNLIMVLLALMVLFIILDII